MDANTFKQVMRRYATGVMVLTVPDGAGFHAVTVNSAASVSLEPTLVLVCLEKNRARTHWSSRSARLPSIFCPMTEAEIGKTFAYDRAARDITLAQVQAQPDTEGALIINGSLAFLECRVIAAYPGGDHTIFLSEVTKLGSIK